MMLPSSPARTPHEQLGFIFLWNSVIVGDWGITGLIEGVWRVAVKIISFFSNITDKISLYNIRNNFIAYSEVWAV